MPKKYCLFMPVSIILVLFLLIGGCGPQDRGLSQASTSIPTTPRGITGSIKTGKMVAASSVNVAAGGGTISVNKPGDPLDGMQIDIPSGAYASSKQFKISYAPVESQSFGADFNPVTPMITVDNGGGYADEIISVKIPVKVPVGDFAMGFFYDNSTGKLEGMPTISTDAESITIGTRHFSSFLVSTIAKTKLQGTFDSGFRPGVNDWEFPNYGSYAASDGHCAGQSMTAMWYYCTQPEGTGIHLYGRYDNNGNKPATPTLWQDDSLGYRLCSVVQRDMDWDSLLRIISKAYLSQSSEATLMMFGFAMMMTGEPQYVGISNTVTGGGHALIVYRVDRNGLYVADPNLPGVATKIIEYVAGKFNPYVSGEKADNLNKPYDKITYVSKTALVDWDTIAQHWTEFKNKTIGNDKFPVYSLIYLDDQGRVQELTDGTTFAVNRVRINQKYPGGFLGVNVFRDGVELQYDASGYIELKPGNNLLGIWIRQQWENDLEYVDFQYVNVIYGGLTLKPATQEAWPGKTIFFDLELTEAAPKGAHFEWFVDGVLKKSGYDFGIDVSFPDVGTHIIAVKLVDTAGKVLMQAQGTAVIKALTTTAFVGNNITALQKMKTFTGFFQGQCNIKEKTDPVYFSVSMSNWSGLNTPIDISWSGASFSGTVTSQVDGGTQTSAVSGTVSSDGKTLTSFSFAYSRKSNYTGGSGVVVQDNTISVQFKNIPIYDLVYEGGSNSDFNFYTYGPEVKSYLVKYEQHFLTSINGKLSSESTYLPDTINWNWSGSGMQGLPQLRLHFK
jgi:hypothetical protein